MDKDSKAYKSKEFDEIFREAEIDNLVNEEAVAYSQSRLKYEETLAAVDYASNSSFERGIAIGEERGREAERMDTARKLRDAGFDEELIKSVTGISV